MRRRFIGLLSGLLWLSWIGAAAVAASDPPALTVAAAASLTDVLQKVGDEFTRASGIPVKLTFAASSALARQIESGASVDIFVSADEEWMDYLSSRKLIDAATRRDVVANRLALVAPADSSIALTIKPGFALRAALGRNGRLATGDPDSVPAGKYAKSALQSLGVWQEIESRLVRAENVRAALAFVSRGETPLGIVYQTDAKVDPNVRVVGLFPEDSHTPITYPVAATVTARTQSAAFIDFLFTPTARDIFERAGFQPFLTTQKQ